MTYFIDFGVADDAVRELRGAVRQADAHTGADHDVHYFRASLMPSSVATAFGAAFSATRSVAVRTSHVANNIEAGAQATRIADYLEG